MRFQLQDCVCVKEITSTYMQKTQMYLQIMQSVISGRTKEGFMGLNSNGTEGTRAGSLREGATRPDHSGRGQRIPPPGRPSDGYFLL